METTINVTSRNNETIKRKASEDKVISVNRYFISLRDANRIA